LTNLALRGDDKYLAAAAGTDIAVLRNPAEETHVTLIDSLAGFVSSVAFSSDGEHLYASTSDGLVTSWRGEPWRSVARYRASNDRTVSASSLQFNPKRPLAAYFRTAEPELHIWNITHEDSFMPAGPTVQYANAKVVLVGDSGVGKSGLALVLTGMAFAATESSHGRNVYRLEANQVEVSPGVTENREIFLWDLAGQPGYRLIHQLHLNDVAAALVTFDARSETDPFGGVRHWNRALEQAQRLTGRTGLRKFLVAARIDRGRISASRARIAEVELEFGFDSYFETSAKTGTGVKELLTAIRSSIDWEGLPKVTSTEFFEDVRRFLGSPDRSLPLLSTREDLLVAFVADTHTDRDLDEVRADFFLALGRLESRGLLRRFSFGDFVLLRPEVLDSYASAIVEAAKDEPDGLGCISELVVRSGEFQMPAEERILNATLEKLLLPATIEDLLRHEIALLEQADDGPQLVFPAQFTRDWPEAPDPVGKETELKFTGPVLNMYASLVVRVARSGSFRRRDLWRNAATFEPQGGGVCGLYLTTAGEGEGMLALFYSPDTRADAKITFEQYVFTHLSRRSLSNVARTQTAVCPACATAVSRSQNENRRARGFDWISCNVCDARISLLQRAVETNVVGPAVSKMDDAADEQISADAGIISASGEISTKEFVDWAGAERTIIALAFTDIVGSTPIAIELGNEAMGELKRAHFAAATKLVGDFEGYLIKTLGDGVMAAFHTVGAAVEFCGRLSAAPGDPRVEIRAAVHVGPILVEGRDASGLMLHYAQRVLSAAGPRELWISDDSHRSLREERIPRLETILWGEHIDVELKGFPVPARLWSSEMNAGNLF
jgi:class 3 adenylate cyclase/GTPase SAR1 family protein